MHNLNIKIIAVLLAFFLTRASTSASTRPAYAGPPLGQVDIKNYYPSIVGEYFRVQLAPRAVLPVSGCPLGSFYVDNVGTLLYCQPDPTFPGQTRWDRLPEVWRQNGNDIYLTNWNRNLQVGIGTANPIAQLTLEGDGGILAKGLVNDPNGVDFPPIAPGAYFIWHPKTAAFRVGEIKFTNAWAISKIGDFSVAMGLDNEASGVSSTVVGGEGNIASEDYSTIGGGFRNFASGLYASIPGGDQNIASNYAATAAGRQNQATAQFATVAGGWQNLATAEGATIVGGVSNLAQTPYSTITGGENNRILGFLNAQGYSTITGGLNNIIQPPPNPLLTTANYGTITGGRDNLVSADYATVTGGESNVASGIASTVSGGFDNTASGRASTVMGGRQNFASGNFSTVSGGLSNTASGLYATVSGGERNTASGIGAVIMGGTDNIAAGDYSWAGGENMRLTANAVRSFLWGHSTPPLAPVTVNTPNAFIIYSGKVGIRDQDPAALLEINKNGAAVDPFVISNSAGSAGDVFIIKADGRIGINKANPSLNNALEFNGASPAHLKKNGQWTPASSRQVKKNIYPLSLRDARQALQGLQPVSFNYKIAPQQTSLGFIAEDVPEILASETRKDLAELDIIAVLTKISQDHETRIDRREKKIRELRREIEMLKKRIE